MESILGSISAEGRGAWEKPHRQEIRINATVAATFPALPEPKCRHSVLVVLSALHFLIELLKYEEGLLFLPMLGYQPFAVEVVFDSRQRAPGTTKVFQNPWCKAAQKRNTLQHGNLVLIKILLIFLAPPRERVAMVTKARVAAKFAHDERLIISRYPVGHVCIGRTMYVPANILIVTQYIQIASDGIVNAERDAVSVSDFLIL